MLESNFWSLLVPAESRPWADTGQEFQGSGHKGGDRAWPSLCPPLEWGGVWGGVSVRGTGVVVQGGQWCVRGGG